MSLEALEHFLEEEIGLHSESIGRTTVQRVVRLRMETSGCGDIQTYYARVRADKEELQALIDEVTVPETWFFRDREPFQYLNELISQQWPEVFQGRRMLRVLSVPCATGEEPYSVAMVMHDLGIANQVYIDAMDISTRALASARRAVYRNNAFRGDEGGRRGCYFQKVDAGYQLHDYVRERVTFLHGNILDPKSLRGECVYDIIFCRNLLIYFDRPVQVQAIDKLHRLLTNDGVLFVGHAETGRLMEGRFKSMKRPGTFAFKKCVSDAPELATAASAGSAGADGDATQKLVTARPPARAFKAFPPTVSTAQSAPRPDVDAQLQQAQLYADQGRLDEAARLCLDYLMRHPVATQAYYLLGVIREAEGQDGVAEDMFRKAVYLEPQHYHALVHLATRAELRGDSAQAAVFRMRARRAAGSEKTS